MWMQKFPKTPQAKSAYWKIHSLRFIVTQLQRRKLIFWRNMDSDATNTHDLCISLEFD